MKPVSFEIVCPSNMSNQRVHWSVRHKLFKRVCAEVKFFLISTKQLPSFNEALVLMKEPVKRFVKFTRFWGKCRKEMDHDGFVNATKPVLDALCCGRGIGLIFDDAPRWCAVTWEQIKDPARAGKLRIEVMEV